MKYKVGKTDKVMRMVLALVIGGLGIYFSSWRGLLALLPLITGLVSFCPVYTIVGLNTCTPRSVQ